MKKTVVLCTALALLVTLGFGAWAEDAAPKGIQPLMIQAAFYTPTYQCFYMKGTDKLGLADTPNVWNIYTAKISKANIDYDGIGGKFKKLNVIRIKSNTKKSKEPVTVYLDNITVKDGAGKTIFLGDFEDGTNGGVYVSQGKALPGNATVVEMAGKKCFLLNMNSQNLYGYNGVEVQWTLPEFEGEGGPEWDFSKEDYTVSFDFYLAVGK